MAELKPCPFCGKSVMIYYSSATNGYYFMHSNSKMITDCILLTPSTICGNYHNLTEAYEAWNRRADNG